MAKRFVGDIAGLIFIVNISAGMHLHDVKKDDVQVCQHHVLSADEVQFTYLGEPTRVVRKRSLYQRMRIHVHFDPETIPQLDARLKNFIQKELIPESVEYFRNTLKVRSVKTPIRLTRKCKTGTFIIKSGRPIPYCVGECEAVQMCGTSKVPAEHLRACYMMDGDSGVKVGSDGAGVDTDFILYASAKNTPDCGTKLIAFASYCQLESALDRPVAGYVNICPKSTALDGAKYKRAGAIATIKHEIYHALGFSSGLFGYYRDKDGNPMTNRDAASGRPPIENGKVVWSSNITREVHWPHWKKVTMVVTPAVVREARRHFGCDTLEGGELEDQGGEGTKGSHWEKRVFENEAMTGVLTQNPVFSRVTLALMEDTGWYHVNYRMAEALQYGFGKGCDFAEYSCKKFMQIKKKAEESVSPYCDKMDDKLTCTLDWKAIAMCNLHKSTAIIDPKYQPFTSLDGVDSANVPYYGGDVEEADYCPFVRTTTHVTATGKVGSTQCAISENQVPDDTNYLRELYSSDSVCLRHKEKWTLQRPGALTKQLPSRFGGGCYKIECASAEEDGLVVYVDDTRYKCNMEGEELSVVSQRKKFNHYGIIICPSYKKVCLKLTAPEYPGDVELWGETIGSAVSACPVNWTIVLCAVVMQIVLFNHITSTASFLLC